MMMMVPVRLIIECSTTSQEQERLRKLEEEQRKRREEDEDRYRDAEKHKEVSNYISSGHHIVQGNLVVCRLRWFYQCEWKVGQVKCFIT